MIVKQRSGPRNGCAAHTGGESSAALRRSSRSRSVGVTAASCSCHGGRSSAGRGATLAHPIRRRSASFRAGPPAQGARHGASLGRGWQRGSRDLRAGGPVWRLMGTAPVGRAAGRRRCGTLPASPLGGGSLRIDRQPVLQLHHQHAAGEPAQVVLRLPLGSVLGHFLVAIQGAPRCYRARRRAAARRFRQAMSSARPIPRAHRASPGVRRLTSAHQAAPSVTAFAGEPLSAARASQGAQIPSALIGGAFLPLLQQLDKLQVFDGNSPLHRQRDKVERIDRHVNRRLRRHR